MGAVDDLWHIHRAVTREAPLPIPASDGNGLEPVIAVLIRPLVKVSDMAIHGQLSSVHRLDGGLFLVLFRFLVSVRNTTEDVAYHVHCIANQIGKSNLGDCPVSFGFDAARPRSLRQGPGNGLITARILDLISIRREVVRLIWAIPMSFRLKTMMRTAIEGGTPI